ncbi:sensor histidine kinase [Streptomyces sp. SID3343]|uniref:sensor histidine kinase n=1 Tax=Streptomyces sp. SID3343 TaxID=2690260 RepID=UPI001371EB07|nr:sensor histidine kinase [Streptomyces sp. SID3343]MYV97717.1 sensor histidine kinase [Streptomyces sp. SID3343]
MTKSLSFAVRGRWWPGVGALSRVGRQTLVRSLYLITAPVTAVVGLLPVLGGVFAATIGLLLPGGSSVAARALAPARWCADLERWRIAKVRPSAPGVERVGLRPGQKGNASAHAAGSWLDAAHAVVVLPVTLVTFAVTALWWFVGLACVTCALRYRYAPPESLRPLSLNAGSAESHVTVSLGLLSPVDRVAFGTVVGLLVLFTLPLVTRACTTAQTGLGQALLSDASALHRRISGLEQERDTARAQTVAAVTAEATALRRLERDIHDGPQQRLVRLAMELGRAQHYFDSRPETVRAALADAIVQTQEALEELRALSRGIAPPILVDRGLHEALTALAARSTVPAELDTVALDRRLDTGVETTAYFVIAESLTNVAKHSHAHRCVIGLRHSEGTLRIWVTDDGVGGAAPAKGHGLRGLDERLHAVGGRLRVSSPSGGPTTITAVLPCC